MKKNLMHPVMKLALASLIVGGLGYAEETAPLTDNAAPKADVPAAPKANDKVQNREKKQQERISKGVQDGKINPKEAAKLNDQQKKIEDTRTKAMQDGKMDRKEA